MVVSTGRRAAKEGGEKDISRLSWVLLPALALCAVVLPGTDRGVLGWPPHPAGGATLQNAERYGALPLRFEPNVGQADPSVLYIAHGAGYTLFLTRTGAILSFIEIHPSERKQSRRSLDARSSRSATLRLSFAGANSPPRVQPEQRRSGIVNYFIGNDPKKWHTNIPTYSRVVYHGVYPGIDLVFYGNGGQLEYDWRIHPHANPAAIAMTIGGAKSVHLDHSGNLSLGTSLGVIRQQAPHVFQMRSGQRIAVDGAYRLAGRTRVNFRLARYDHAQPLIIDPVLAFGTYLGGGDIATGVAFDSSGDAYLTGGLQPTVGFIPTRGPYQSASAGDVDAFITELNPSGSDLIYSTYLGGAKYDFAHAIAVDGSGSAYVTGRTESSDFPGLSGLIPPYTAVAFVVKLSPTGKIVYAHGYPHPDGTGTAIAVDGAGDAFYTANLKLPGALQSYSALIELAPDGSLFPGYHFFTGSSGDTVATGVALDGQGNVYVAGYTNAPDFPVTNALQPKLVGGYDAFVAKFDSGLNLVFRTFLGGGGDDYANAVAVDANGNVYVAGYTTSTNFPTAPTASPLQSSLAGKQDGFVTELNPSGTALVYSTYLGGRENGFEQFNAIATDGAGNAYVTGQTTAADYPTVNPLPNSGFKGYDAVVSEIAAGGRSLAYSTYLGGADSDIGYAIAVDAAGNAYVAGFTLSTDFPTSPSAYQHGLGGVVSAFAVKLVAPPPPTPTPTSTPTPTPTATSTPTSTPTPTSTAVSPPTATGTSQPTATSTPVPTSTSTPTTIPAATATSTPVPTPTSTPIPTATATKVPPPETPEIFLKSSTITSGGKLKITVITSPNAEVTITIQAKSGKAVLFRAVSMGRADGSGKFTKRIKITYNPDKQVKARVAVEAKNAGGSTVSSTKITILHHP
jgi:hypothetical protein